MAAWRAFLPRKMARPRAAGRDIRGRDGNVPLKPSWGTRAHYGTPGLRFIRVAPKRHTSFVVWIASLITCWCLMTSRSSMQALSTSGAWESARRVITQGQRPLFDQPEDVMKIYSLPLDRERDGRLAVVLPRS